MVRILPLQHLGGVAGEAILPVHPHYRSDLLPPHGSTSLDSSCLRSVTSATKFVLALARWAHRPTPPGGHLGDEGPPIAVLNAGKYGRIWNVLIADVEEARGRIYGCRAIIAPRSDSPRTGMQAGGALVVRSRTLAGNNDV